MFSPWDQARASAVCNTPKCLQCGRYVFSTGSFALQICFCWVVQQMWMGLYSGFCPLLLLSAKALLPSPEELFLFSILSLPFPWGQYIAIKNILITRSVLGVPKCLENAASPTFHQLPWNSLLHYLAKARQKEIRAEKQISFPPVSS